VAKGGDAFFFTIIHARFLPVRNRSALILRTVSRCTLYMARAKPRLNPPGFGGSIVSIGKN
jgi:hypothetical protein